MDSKSYKEYLEDITAFIFDVDGVLTDSSVLVTSEGEMLRKMSTRDGFALKTAVDAGFLICIISGGKNEGVRKRLKGLGVQEISLGSHDKVVNLNALFAKHQLNPGLDQFAKIVAFYSSYILLKILEQTTIAH